MGKLTEQASKESEERLRELADAIPQIVWIAAPDGGLTYLNAKATEYTGIGTDQLKVGLGIASFIPTTFRTRSKYGPRR